MTDQPMPPVAWVPGESYLTQYDDEYSFNNHRGWWWLMAPDDVMNPPMRELPPDAVRLVPLPTVERIRDAIRNELGKAEFPYEDGITLQDADAAAEIIHDLLTGDTDAG